MGFLTDSHIHHVTVTSRQRIIQLLQNLSTVTNRGQIEPDIFFWGGHFCSNVFAGLKKSRTLKKRKKTRSAFIKMTSLSRTSHHYVSP